MRDACSGARRHERLLHALMRDACTTFEGMRLHDFMSAHERGMRGHESRVQRLMRAEGMRAGCMTFEGMRDACTAFEGAPLHERDMSGHDMRLHHFMSCTCTTFESHDCTTFEGRNQHRVNYIDMSTGSALHELHLHHLHRVMSGHELHRDMRLHERDMSGHERRLHRLMRAEGMSGGCRTFEGMRDACTAFEGHDMSGHELHRVMSAHESGLHDMRLHRTAPRHERGMRGHESRVQRLMRAEGMSGGCTTFEGMRDACTAFESHDIGLHHPAPLHERDMSGHESRVQWCTTFEGRNQHRVNYIDNRWGSVLHELHLHHVRDAAPLHEVMRDACTTCTTFEGHDMSGHELHRVMSGHERDMRLHESGLHHRAPLHEVMRDACTTCTTFEGMRDACTAFESHDMRLHDVRDMSGHELHRDMRLHDFMSAHERDMTAPLHDMRAGCMT